MSPKRSWLLDETASAGLEHLDREYVGRYDHKAAIDPTADLTTLRKRGLGASSMLLDLGCGTGEFALAAAAVAGRVVAVDVSRPMLDALRAKVSSRSLTNVEAVEGGFLTYKHRGSPPDFVYTRNALHHLPDFWKAMALQRLADLLPSGGVLLLRDLIYSFEPREAAERLEEWFASASRTADIGWTREELEMHVRAEYSTFSWLLEPMLARTGFAIEAVSHAESSTYAAYVCVKT